MVVGVNTFARFHDNCVQLFFGYRRQHMDAYILLYLLEQLFDGQRIFIGARPRGYLLEYWLCGLLQNVIDAFHLVGVHYCISSKFFIHPMLL